MIQTTIYVKQNVPELYLYKIMCQKQKEYKHIMFQKYELHKKQIIYRREQEV